MLLRKYKLKYKYKVTKDIINTVNKTYLTYGSCFRAFKKVIAEPTTLAAFIDKYEKITGKYSEPINCYGKGSKIYLNIKGK